MSSTETLAPVGAVASPDKKTIRQLFDAIAARYDFLNTFLSLTLDESWRRRARDLIAHGADKSILDLGVGTGRFLNLFLENPSLERAVGLDFSGKMLQKANQELSARVELVQADFHDLPFQDASFELVVSSFTLRSVKDLPHFFGEVHRLLVDGGRAGFLCLTRPEHPLWKWIYFPYLKFYLPFMGRLISGNLQAYQFLSASVQTFQEPASTAEMMRQTGFREVEVHAFTFGCATLFLGRK